MNVEIIQQHVFTIKVGGVEFRDLRLVSKWNGVAELHDRRGRKLIVSSVPTGGAFSDTFQDIFGEIFGAKKSDKGTAVLIGADPDLLAQFHAAAEVAKAQAQPTTEGSPA